MQRTLTVELLAKRLTIKAAEKTAEIRVEVTLTEEEVEEWVYALTAQAQRWQSEEVRDAV